MAAGDTPNIWATSTVKDIVETHGYVQKYQWVHAPAFERGNVATVVLVQNVLATKAFVSWITEDYREKHA